MEQPTRTLSAWITLMGYSLIAIRWAMADDVRCSLPVLGASLVFPLIRAALVFYYRDVGDVSSLGIITQINLCQEVCKRSYLFPFTGAWVVLCSLDFLATLPNLFSFQSHKSE